MVGWMPRQSFKKTERKRRKKKSNEIKRPRAESREQREKSLLASIGWEIARVARGFYFLP
jgi:hypothetical protein